MPSCHKYSKTNLKDKTQYYTFYTKWKITYQVEGASHVGRLDVYLQSPADETTAGR